MAERSGFTGTFNRVCAMALVAAALLAGCTSGKDGATGAAGPQGAPGANGQPGSNGSNGSGALPPSKDIGFAKTLTATVTSITGTSAPTINFTLFGENGTPLTGLLASQVSFGIAQLQPAGPAASGIPSQWRSYITTVQQPGGIGWGTAAAVQATIESGKTGTFTDNGNGTYSYTFSKDLPTFAAASTANGVALSYDGTLTHRVGLEIRGTAATPTNNAVYTYLPAGGAVTVTRDIVNNGECNACHDKLALHGGPRTDAQYCVICHNSGTTDAHSGNSLDFKVLVHKIHMGISLPSVVAAAAAVTPPAVYDFAPAQGVGYTIWGYGNSVNNFSTVVWPQDKRNCTTCHQNTDPTTPDADNYKNVPYTAACTTCHDKTDFTTGVGHNGQVATDAQCATCHGPASTIVNPADGVVVAVTSAHAVPELDQLKNFQFQVVKVEPTTDAAGLNLDTTACPVGGSVCLVPPGDYLRVTIKVVNPTTGATIPLTDPGFSPTSFVPNPTNPAAASTVPAVTVDIATTTANFTNPTNPQNTSAGRSPPQTIKFLGYGSAVTAGALTYSLATATATSGTPPTPNADGSYTRTSLFPVTTTINLVGINGNVSGAAFIEGRAVVNVGTIAQPSMVTVGITSAGPAYFPIALANGQAAPAPRRAVVDMNNCNKCHKHLQLHGDGRNSPTNALLCTSCHNPEMSTGAYPAPRDPVTGLPTQPIAGPMDFKFFIHSLHSGKYKYGGHDFTATAPWPTPANPLVLDFSSIPVTHIQPTTGPNAGVTFYGGFPGALNDCEACHVKGADTFYPVDPTRVFSTTVAGGITAYATTAPFKALTPATALVGPADDVAITPNVAACGACHDQPLAQEHMQQQGGVILDRTLGPDADGNPFNYALQPKIKNADGTTKAQYQTETCGVCHGPGGIADVKALHNVGAYQ